MLDFDIAQGAFKVILGSLTGSGAVSLDGATIILNTMVEAHSLYVECLYFSLSGHYSLSLP